VLVLVWFGRSVRVCVCVWGGGGGRLNHGQYRVDTASCVFLVTLLLSHSPPTLNPCLHARAGGPDGTCNDTEKAAFNAGQNQSVYESRVANGWDKPALCNAGGEGITNLTFDGTNTPMCSGSLFERYGRDGLWDMYSLWETAQWQTPYIVAIRGMDKTHTGGPAQFTEGGGFPQNLASFLAVAGPHHYFLQFWQYDCLPQPGQLESTQFIEPPNNE
jgi:hypothetical protein